MDSNRSCLYHPSKYSLVFPPIYSSSFESILVAMTCQLLLSQETRVSLATMVPCQPVSCCCPILKWYFLSNCAKKVKNPVRSRDRISFGILDSGLPALKLNFFIFFNRQNPDGNDSNFKFSIAKISRL